LGGARLARAFGFGGALLDVGERFLHLVDEDEAQIARLQAVEGVVDGGEFAVDFFHVAGAFGALQTLAQQGEDFAVGAAALAGVLVEDDVVEGCAEDAGLFADVFIAPVARAADDDAAAARGRRRVASKSATAHGPASVHTTLGSTAKMPSRLIVLGFTRRWESRCSRR